MAGIVWAVSYIIVVRNPGANKLLVIEEGETDWPPVAEYATREEAEKDTLVIPVCRAWPYEILEIEV